MCANGAKLYVAIFAFTLGVKTCHAENGSQTSISVVHVDFHGVAVYFTVTAFLIAVAVAKMIYHHLDSITTYLPESIVLIALGAVVGVIVYFSESEPWKLTESLFFFILLPPIMLEAAFSLYDRSFVANIGTIAYFAILGTVFNFLLIGCGLYVLNRAGALGTPKLDLSLEHALLFGSLIVAVDPVAVLAIFGEIGVEHSLYYTVFGESVFNDAVTVVLYRMMSAFARMPSISGMSIFIGICSFFTISLGGLLIGIITGMLCCVLTKYTHSARVVEPMVIILSAYFSYVLGDLFHWSGLISIVGCGLVQAAYAFHNVSHKSYTTIKYFTKMLSSVSEAMIFLFLGMELVSNQHIWHWGFCLWALGLCVIARFLVTFLSSWIAGLLNIVEKTSLVNQFVIAFGGLRGAVAFSLATTLDESDLRHHGIDKNMFLTATLFIIAFTCVVMGLLIKPVVKLLHVRIEQTPAICVIDDVNAHVMDHIVAGVEEIGGIKGGHYFKEIFDNYNAKYIRPILQREPETRDEQIVKTFEKVSLRVHLATVCRSKSELNHFTHHLAPNLERKLTHSKSFGDFSVDFKDPKKKKLTVEFNVDTKRRLSGVMLQTSQNTRDLHRRVSRDLSNDDDFIQRIESMKYCKAKNIDILRTIRSDISLSGAKSFKSDSSNDDVTILNDCGHNESFQPVLEDASLQNPVTFTVQIESSSKRNVSFGKNLYEDSYNSTKL